jgi:hypothetical protein
MIVNSFKDILIQLLSLKKGFHVSDNSYALKGMGDSSAELGKSTSGESNGMPSNMKVSAKP